MKLALILAFIAIATGFVLVRQHDMALKLEQDLVLAHKQPAQPKAEAVVSSSGSPSESNLNVMRKEHAAVLQAREEVAQLKSILSRSIAASSAEDPDPVPTFTPDQATAEIQANRTFSSEVRLRADWRDAGRKQVVAAVESLFAHAAAKDYEAFAEDLEFSDYTRQRVTALFAAQPESTRSSLGTPEKMMAALMAADLAKADAFQTTSVRTGTWPNAEQPATRPTMNPIVTISLPTGPVEVRFTFKLHQDGWRLAVPYEVIARYEQVLTGAGP